MRVARLAAWLNEPLASYADAVVRDRGCGPDQDGPSRRNGPLYGLAGSSVAERFRAWTGRSGRRYVFSVFPLDPAAPAVDTIPVEGGSVVIGVERLPDGTRRAIFFAESGATPDAFFRGDLVEGLRSRGAAELHIHLTTGDAAMRNVIVADLAD